MILGIGLQSFAIAYERFHMDPMKRGLINQLITTFMAFLMCYSISRIIRFALEWLAPQPMPNFLFNISTLVGWLVWSGAFGCIITVNEVLIVTYWSKMWLKRVPNYNHDFLATWLNASNVSVALYLGGLQAYNLIERAKNEENVPTIRIFLYLSIVLVLELQVYLVHILIHWFKTRNKTSIVPMVQVFSIPIQEEPAVPTPQLLNTIKYNPDLLNWKVGLGFIAILPPLFYYFYMQNYAEYPPIHLILAMIKCFYIPLIFCTFNPKLRSFILQHVTFRCIDD